VHKIIFHPEMDDLSIGEGRICPVTLSPFIDLLLFRFCVLGFFKELPWSILWGHRFLWFITEEIGSSVL